MTAPADVAAWRDASLAAAIFAVDPGATGVVLRARAGPARDAWLSLLKSLLPKSAPVRRVPLSIDDHALLGGLDLTATLTAGRPVAAAGLLAEADGGVLMIATAERVSPGVAARITAAMDSGEVRTARDGFAIRTPTRFGVVALDEGDGWEERPPAALVDRLALYVDLGSVARRDLDLGVFDVRRVAQARMRLASITVDDEAIAALTTTAAKLGIVSFRAPLLALRTARTLCALRGGKRVDESDLSTAARLVLASRAETLAPKEVPADESPDASESEPRDDREQSEQRSVDDALSDVVLAAAAAAIPPGLLALIEANIRERSKSGRGAQSREPAKLRGRPLAAQRGELRQGRLSVIDTLRAAAPWQKLRRQSAGPHAPRVIVRPDDFRIVRRRARRATTAIFVVDASGSAAAHRLAEVKGAIELLLADCYTRRDSVALISFRGKTAETILAPTRSLTRAKRALADLPGGGGTPLALGLDAAVLMAITLRRKGEAPLLVLMTDGSANIGSDGEAGRTRAFEDALNAGRRAGAAGLAALAIDTSPKMRKQADPPTLQIGRAMNARYIELPSVEATRVSEAVRAAAAAA